MITKNMNYIIISILLTSVLVGVAGQILIKKGLNQHGPIVIKNTQQIIPVLFKVVINPFVFTGLCCSVITALLWFIVLSRNSLSTYSPIFGGLFYIFILIFSWLLLNEPVNLSKIIGVITIILGIIILSLQ